MSQSYVTHDSNSIAGRALKDALAKLNPREQVKNPVMFMVFISAILTTVLFFLSLVGISDTSSGYIAAVAVILWLTVLFANYAEALSEGRGKAQADSLRAVKRDIAAHVVKEDAITHTDKDTILQACQKAGMSIPSAKLQKGDIYYVVAGEQIPADGEIIAGAATVDESAITGESAPVVRESGGDRSSVTGGTVILSDWLVVRVTQESGKSFLDQMIAMVEEATRKRLQMKLHWRFF